MALVAVIASFAALDLVYDHALDSLVAFHLDDSDPAVRNSFPAVVVGLMLLLRRRAGLRGRLHARHGSPAWWRATGVVLVFFGIEEALGLHTWADRHLERELERHVPPLHHDRRRRVVEAARLMNGHRAAQLMFGPASPAGCWRRVRRGPHRPRRGDGGRRAAGDGGRGPAAPRGVHLRPGQLAGRDPAAQSPRESTWRSRAQPSAGSTSRALLIGLAFLAVVFGILGAIVYPGGGDLRAFDLNKEQTFPATFSGVLLLAAGGLALLNGLVRSKTLRGRRWWIVLALVFAFLGLDEIAALHEAVQDRVHVWGQAVLMPVVFVGSMHGGWRSASAGRAARRGAVPARRGGLDRGPRAGRRGIERALGLDDRARRAVRDGGVGPVRPGAAGRAAQAGRGGARGGREPVPRPGRAPASAAAR